MDVLNSRNFLVKLYELDELKSLSIDEDYISVSGYQIVYKTKFPIKTLKTKYDKRLLGEILLHSPNLLNSKDLNKDFLINFISEEPTLISHIENLSENFILEVIKISSIFNFLSILHAISMKKCITDKIIKESIIRNIEILEFQKENPRKKENYDNHIKAIIRYFGKDSLKKSHFKDIPEEMKNYISAGAIIKKESLTDEYE